MENNPTPHGIAALSKTLSDEHLRIIESLEGALTDGQCKALSGDPAEIEMLAFTEAAAIEIRGWK